jgi:hypothetical protein
MTAFTDLRSLADGLNGSIRLHPDATITVIDPAAFRATHVDRLLETAIFGEDEATREAARWLIWEAGHALGAHSASIQGLYVARGKGKVRGFTVPAVNIRGLTYETARAMFRTAKRLDMSAMLFELAKSELGYTFQRPAEYVANVLAAAIKEGWHGPVFIQGDHYQFNAKNYAVDPDKEIEGLRALTKESVAAGYYNIDIDASTLVDLTPPSLDEQQRHNYRRGAERPRREEIEPRGITISVGGEIGEVGYKNSTVESSRRTWTATCASWRARRALLPMSKVSVQTGTSHGGIPTADGQVAAVKLDSTCSRRSARSRAEYGLAGACSTAPRRCPTTCSRFPGRVREIHLRPAFRTCSTTAASPTTSRPMYAWLDQNCADERASGMTDEQFHYKTRKKSYGPFKRELFDLARKDDYAAALEDKFGFLFEKLGMRGTRALVDEYVHPVLVHRPVPGGLKAALEQGAGTRS